MQRYHINPDTGKTGQCSAKVRDCKFAVGDMIPEHYDSKEEAQKAYEKKMETKSKSFPTVTKSKKSVADTKLDVKETLFAYSKFYTEEYAEVFDTVEELMKRNAVMSPYFYHDDAIKYDNNEFIDDDRRYRYEPILEVIDKEEFVKTNLTDARSEVQHFDSISSKTLDALQEIGYFSDANYEAVISGGYYDDYFEGWKMNKWLQKKALPILADELLRKRINKSF